MAGTTTLATRRPPIWRDLRILRVAGQALFVLLVVLAFRELANNLVDALRRQGLDISFGFLDARAGFGIPEGIEYSPNESFRKAYTVGVVNTLRVASLGILLATVIGVTFGVARLSPNWLLRRIAQVYVEAVRNTPVLIQIIFWFFGAIVALPPIQEAATPLGLAVISNRSVAVTWLAAGTGAGTWLAFVAAGVVAAAGVWWWRTRRNERSGEPHHRVLWALATVVVLAGIGWFVSGSPLGVNAPEVVGRRVEGGTQFSAGFTALLAGLVVYTSAFIAETVRGSILAVSKGQKEAAEALGLTPFQQLRFVVLPQAMRIAIPPINSQYLNLTKNSSLGLAIAFPELMGVSRTIINQSAKATEMLVIVMATYLAMSLFISLIMNGLNRVVALRGDRR